MATFDTLPEITNPQGDDYILIRQGGQARKIKKSNFLKEFDGITTDIAALKDMTFSEVITANDYQTAANSSYHIVGDINVILPNTNGRAVGDRVVFTKDQDNSPTVEVFDTVTQEIQTTKGNDSSVIFDINSEVIFVFNGTQWEV